jgi:ABC-type glycerol-3-phosphate transport system permease component
MSASAVRTGTTPARSPATSRRRRGRRGVVARTVLAVVVGLIFVAPLYQMVVTAFSPHSDIFGQTLHLWPSTPTLGNFRFIVDSEPIWTWFENSVEVATLTTIVTVVVNTLAGYAFAKLNFPWKTPLFLILLATMMIPTQAIIISQFRIVLKLDLFGTFWAVIIPGAAAAFGIFLSRQFMLAIPDELLEAARVDGAGRLRVFVSIVLPLCKPLLAVLALLTFMYQWNDFLWPLIALQSSNLYTLPVGLQFLQGQFTNNYPAIMALALLSCVPMVILFLAFQRYFVQGLARSGIR